MNIGDTVYYIQRGWRRLVPGRVVNSDDKTVVMSVEDKYMWFNSRKYVEKDFSVANDRLNNFIAKYGLFPIQGEQYEDQDE